MRFLRPVFVLAILITCTGTALSQKIDPAILRNSPKVLQAFRDVVAKPSQYTVRVQSDGKDAAFGTIVDANGFILTKASELTGQKLTVKMHGGAIHEAYLLGRNDDYDLAMLKIDASDLPTVEWLDSKHATVGRWVATVGVGSDPAAIGVVSVATRAKVLGDQPPKISNPNAGYLGVGLEAGMGGAKVTAVSPKTPAEKAGLKLNDVIYEAAGVAIPDHEALIATIQRHKANDAVLLKVRRGEEELELKVVLAPLPKAMLGNPQERMGGPLSTRRGDFPFILQHDTVLKPQDCGGPLVDLDGKTVGINIARAGRTESYAIPAEKVLLLLGDLKSGKSAVKVAPGDPELVLRAVGTLSKKDTLSTIRKGSFMKVHDVKLTAGATYVIEMESNDIDSYLILEDAAGKKLAEDDNEGGFPNAKLVFRAPTSGMYRVVACTFRENETGNYTLSVRKQVDKN